MDRTAALAPIVSAVASIRAGRTGTRAVRGKAHARGHDGIQRLSTSLVDEYIFVHFAFVSWPRQLNQ